MQRIIFLALAAVLSVSLCACNTVAGMGKDAQSAVNYFTGATDKDKNDVHVDPNGTVTTGD